VGLMSQCCHRSPIQFMRAMLMIFEHPLDGDAACIRAFNSWTTTSRTMDTLLFFCAKGIGNNN
jgi:hypothetical protein